MKLVERTILITGGNSGIGYQLAKQLHAKNNRIIIVSRTRNNWQGILEKWPDIKLFQCDLSQKSEVLQLLETLRSKEQQEGQQVGLKIDSLIHCAAIQNTPRLVDNSFSFDDIEVEVTTNFTSIVWLTHQFLPSLLARPEAMIVNLSSGLAIYPKTSSAVYCATKAAVHSFSQSLRYQLMDSKVSVVEVLLPLVETPMTRGRGSNKMSPSDAALHIIEGVERNKTEIYVGKAKVLPFLSRISPSLTKYILKKA